MEKEGIKKRFDERGGILLEKSSKFYRTLDMYIRLCEGRVVNKAEEAVRFQVDERSIQRDIDDIRAFLAEQTVINSKDNRRIEYSRAKLGFVMTENEGSIMDNSEILAVSKILLESRAFTKKEITGIIDKMIRGCVPYDNMKLVKDLISNEKHHYVELHSRSRIKDKLWDLGTHIKAHNLLEITYQKQINSKEVVTRCIQPLALLFSEYYFYLNANIAEKNEKGIYVAKYEYPAIFRIDRIKKYKDLKEKFKIDYTNRFEEGEFRKRIQFMHAGELIKIQFRFTGNSVSAVLDRLPTAKVIKEEKNGVIIEAEVYGKGVLMWLLSQGTMVEVLKPDQYREEVKKILTEMLGKYEGE